MEFHYIATTARGRVEQGVINAATREAVADILRARDLMVMSIDATTGLKKIQSKTLDKFSLRRVSLIDKVIFSRHLALMLRSGLAMLEALQVISEQTTSKKMKAAIDSIIKAVSNGESLSSGMERYPKIFSGVFIGMVKVGEASGTLERNLEFVGTTLEKDYDLKRKVMAAMIYPIIILVMTFFVAMAMTFFVLPKLVKMFDTFNIALPVATRVFISLSKFLVANGLYVFAGIAAVVIGLRFLIKAKRTKPFFHKINVSLPFIKNLIRNLNLARINRMLAVLLKSGVTINEGLRITAQSLDNVIYQRIIFDAVESVKKGQSLASAFEGNHLIPTMTSRMIAVGEKTGKLEDNLFYLTSYYEGEVDQATKNLSSVIGPVLMVVIGVVLGLLAIAIISPIYQFTGTLGGGGR